MAERWIIMAGHPIDGYTFYGLFPGQGEAEEWAAGQLLSGVDFAVELEPADVVPETHEAVVTARRVLAEHDKWDPRPEELQKALAALLEAVDGKAVN